MFLYCQNCFISGISIGQEDTFNNELLDTVFLKMFETNF